MDEIKPFSADISVGNEDLVDEISIPIEDQTEQKPGVFGEIIRDQLKLNEEDIKNIISAVEKYRGQSVTKKQVLNVLKTYNSHSDLDWVPEKGIVNNIAEFLYYEWRGARHELEEKIKKMRKEGQRKKWYKLGKFGEFYHKDKGWY